MIIQLDKAIDAMLMSSRRNRKTYLNAPPLRVVYVLCGGLDLPDIQPNSRQRTRQILADVHEGKPRREAVWPEAQGYRHLILEIYNVIPEGWVRESDTTLCELLARAPRNGARGRRPMFEESRIIRGTVTPDIAAFVEQYGEGNISEGIRRLAKEAMQEP